MAETRNNRIGPALAAEARENAQRYWARKTDSAPLSARPDESLGVPQDAQTASLLSRLKEAADTLQAAEARIKVLEGALRPFAAFRLDGFEGEVLEVVPSSPSNPARRIEPIWTSHFRQARSALPQLGGENG